MASLSEDKLFEPDWSGDRMGWLVLLLLMLLVSAAPGVSIYLEHLRAAPVEPGDGVGDGPPRAA